MVGMTASNKLTTLLTIVLQMVTVKAEIEQVIEEAAGQARGVLLYFRGIKVSRRK